MAGFGDCPFGTFSYGETCVTEEEIAGTPIRFARPLLSGLPLPLRRSTGSKLTNIITVLEEALIEVGGESYVSGF